MNIDSMVSATIKNIPPSGIRKFFDILAEVKDAISLGIGEPDFVTPWNIMEAGIYSLEQGHTHYTSNWGLRELREEIANYQKRKYGLMYDPKDEIIVTVGGSEAIDAAMRCLLTPGDEVIVPEPSFVCYKPCTLFSGGVPVTIQLKEKDEFRLTPEALSEKITDRTKLLVIPFPNNPTGSIMEMKDLEKIAEVIIDKDIMIISDEIYSELTYGEKHVSIASIPEMKDRTIVINGFSKTFAMTGWRLGYACAHKSVIAGMFKIHQYGIMSSPTTAQYAGIEALKNSDDDVELMFNEYNRRRRFVVDAFRKMGLDCFEPKGAFYVFPSIKATGMTSSEFCETLLLEEKVALIPGTAFSDAGEGYIRCAYCNSFENISEAMQRVARFVARRINTK